MRPDLGPDDAYNGPDGRYADLVGEDASLLQIVGALDGLYGQGEPPARVAAEIERAMAAHAEQSTVAIQRGGQRERRDRWGMVLPFEGGAGRTGTKGSATMKITRKRLSTLAAVAAAVVVVGLMALLLRGFGPGSGVGSNGGPAIATAQAQVFAHSGGVEVVAALSCPNASTGCDTAGAQRHIVSILTQRLSSALTNVPALTVQPLGATDLVIDVAGSHPASDILPLLDVGGFEVLDTGPTQLDVGADVSGKTCVSGCQSGQYQVLFTDTDLDPSSVQVELNPADGQPVILFAFRGQARSSFAQYTGSHIGQYLTMAIDNKVVESAVIQSQIDGQGQVEGVGTAQQARNLAAFMKYGALPVALTVVTTQTVGVGNQRSGQSSGPGICATLPATPTPAASGAAAPAATPGPQSKFVQNVTTATGVDSKYLPVHTTSYFPVNTDVYVVANVRNISAGQQHTISIHWFLDNQDLNLAPNGGLSRSITQNTNLYFSLTYPTPGLGTAKIYFDRPANDPASDTAYLAATIDFLVQQANAPVPTPTAIPEAGGGSTCQTPTPAPTSPGGFSPTPPPPGPTPTPPPTSTPGPPPTPTPTPAS